MTTATIGTVSHGTMREEDLIPTFLDMLDMLNKDQAEHIIAEYEYDDDFDYDSEEAGWMLEALFDALNDEAPAYCYFGAIEGDGSDYGFWPVIDQAEEDDDVLKVNDTGDVSDDYIGYVLHVNDHGNATLYNADHGKLSEVWSIV